jgi:hypothetical protein
VRYVNAPSVCLTAARVAELARRLRFYLADPLARDIELLADYES